MEENPAVSAAEEPVEEWGAGGGAEWDTQHPPQAEPGMFTTLHELRLASSRTSLTHTKPTRPFRSQAIMCFRNKV